MRTLDTRLIRTTSKLYKGFPENETELYAARRDWERHDVVDEVLRTLRLREAELSWRRSWPTPAYSKAQID
jgi:hypothetical protein